jgi:hypothetical protein
MLTPTPAARDRGRTGAGDGPRLINRPSGGADAAGVCSPSRSAAGQAVTEVSPRARSDRSPLEVEFERQVRGLLGRIAAQERLAQDASDLEEFFAWPSWSMDTGLTAAQEKFVEHWSPQRVLDDSRSLRQLVRVLQHWTRTHRDDDELDEALTILATCSAG